MTEAYIHEPVKGSQELVIPEHCTIASVHLALHSLDPSLTLFGWSGDVDRAFLVFRAPEIDD